MFGTQTRNSLLKKIIFLGRLRQKLDSKLQRKNESATLLSANSSRSAHLVILIRVLGRGSASTLNFCSKVPEISDFCTKVAKSRWKNPQFGAEYRLAPLVHLRLDLLYVMCQGG